MVTLLFKQQLWKPLPNLGGLGAVLFHATMAKQGQGAEKESKPACVGWENPNSFTDVGGVQHCAHNADQICSRSLAAE